MRTIDTSICATYSASGLGLRKQICVDQSIASDTAPLPLVPLLYDHTHRHRTVSASSLSKSTRERPPQSGNGNFGDSLQMKVPDARTAFLIDFT